MNAPDALRGYERVTEVVVLIVPAIHEHALLNVEVVKVAGRLVPTSEDEHDELDVGRSQPLVSKLILQCADVVFAVGAVNTGVDRVAERERVVASLAAVETGIAVQ